MAQLKSAPSQGVTKHYPHLNYYCTSHLVRWYVWSDLSPPANIIAGTMFCSSVNPMFYTVIDKLLVLNNSSLLRKQMVKNCSTAFYSVTSRFISK